MSVPSAVELLPADSWPPPTGPPGRLEARASLDRREPHPHGARPDALLPTPGETPATLATPPDITTSEEEDVKKQSSEDSPASEESPASDDSPAKPPPRLDCPSFHLADLPDTPSTEKFRDIPGPFTLHRGLLLAFLVGLPYAIYTLQNVVWPPTSGTPDRTWALLSIFLFVPLPSVVAWIVGALLFRHNRELDAVERMSSPVVFRLVSRGTNSDCLLATIRRCQAELRNTPLFPYLIELVTDGDCFSAPLDADILHLRVPDDYSTPNASRFKARALHFACVSSAVPDHAWVVHLDEETHLTSSSIKGIADMIARAEASGNVRRVGQGCILYHRSWATHPVLTLADMRRTGDDIGHFHLQHRLGVTIFGLHGSYVVCRADVEREIGFDVGPDGSITEDAWWILLAAEKGVRTCWVDGYMEEQSTQGVLDFVKQRRRWYFGLWKVGMKCPVALRRRLLLLYNIVCWICLPILLPLQLLYVVLSMVYSKEIVLVVRLLTSIMMATSLAVYVSGLLVNMREHGTPFWRVPFWLVLQLLLFPVFYCMEALAIFMTFFSPLSQNAKGFHVVQKSDYLDKSDSSGSMSNSSEDAAAEGVCTEV